MSHKFLLKSCKQIKSLMIKKWKFYLFPTCYEYTFQYLYLYMKPWVMNYYQYDNQWMANFVLDWKIKTDFVKVFKNVILWKENLNSLWAEVDVPCKMFLIILL